MSVFLNKNEENLANDVYLNEIQFRKDEFGNRMMNKPSYSKWVEDEIKRVKTGSAINRQEISL